MVGGGRQIKFNLEPQKSWAGTGALTVVLWSVQAQFFGIDTGDVM